MPVSAQANSSSGPSSVSLQMHSSPSIAPLRSREPPRPSPESVMPCASAGRSVMVSRSSSKSGLPPPRAYSERT